MPQNVTLPVSQQTLQSLLTEFCELRLKMVTLQRQIHEVLDYVDHDQRWYWRDDWQQQMLEAKQDLKFGRVKTHDSVDALMADLNSKV
jgi:hypothetical protein